MLHVPRCVIYLAGWRALRYTLFGRNSLRSGTLGELALHRMYYMKISLGNDNQFNAFRPLYTRFVNAVQNAEAASGHSVTSSTRTCTGTVQ